MNKFKLSPLVRAKFRTKIRSLAEEARIIRHEERKTASIPATPDIWDGTPNFYKRDSTRSILRHHRVTVVRDEARATLLAYAYLRGVPYKAVEPKANKELPTESIIRIAKSLQGWGYTRIEPHMLKAWAEAVPMSENVA